MDEDAEKLIELLCQNDISLLENKEFRKFSIPECDEIARRTGIKRTIILYEYYYGNKE